MVIHHKISVYSNVICSEMLKSVNFFKEIFRIHGSSQDNNGVHTYMYMVYIHYEAVVTIFMQVWWPG